MRWAPFLVAMALALVVDRAFMPVLEIGGAVPLTLAALVAFVTLFAGRNAAWFAAVVAGAAHDLSSPEFWGGRELVVIGPWALGFAFGAGLLLSLRASLVRRNVLTMALAVFLLLMTASLVWCAVWSARAWLPESLPPWQTDTVFGAFGDQFRTALWSSAVAIPVGWALSRTMGLWGFPGFTSRRTTIVPR